MRLLDDEDGPDDNIDLVTAFWTNVREYEDPAAAEAIKASRATSADIDIPVPPSLQYLDFQKAAILYCLKKLGDWK